MPQPHPHFGAELDAEVDVLERYSGSTMFDEHWTITTDGEV